MSGWIAQRIRFTAFVNPSLEHDVENWWRAAVGEDPEVRTTKPRTGVVSQESAKAGGRLILRTEPGRIDWALVAPEDPETDGIENLGEANNAIGLFVNFVRAWLDSEDRPRATRLAYAPVLVQPVATREKGYELLAQYLKGTVTIDASKMQEFLFQVNRPTTIAVGDASELQISVNRLCKWSVANWTKVALRAGADGAAVSSSATQSFACLLDMDINTVLSAPLCVDQKQEREILGKLEELAREISESGDPK